MQQGVRRVMLFLVLATQGAAADSMQGYRRASRQAPRGPTAPMWFSLLFAEMKRSHVGDYSSVK